MYYVYVLKHRHTGELYYGYTNDVQRRLAEHQQVAVWELVYYEAYRSELDAHHREQRLKHYAQALTVLKLRLQASLQ